MLRFVEKKNWRKNVESCWQVSDQINSCLNNSNTFSQLDSNAQAAVRNSVSRNYITQYLSAWVEGSNATESLLNRNSQLFTSLNSECNLNSLHECCREKFSLENLEGDYENFAQKLKK